VFDEGELVREGVVANYATTAADGKTYQVEFFNLDVIISVGYRVKSQRGTQFRIWATQRLKEYIVKGFAMDDERLKRGGGGNYFEELLARIRDIRSSEKEFWRKVLEIYATSIDYDPSVEASQQFFATVQNKMHWAAHGQTAAEVIHARANAARPNVGMTNWLGDRPSKSEAVIAKNYLTPEELEALNRIVTAYLEFAELQALNRKPMHNRIHFDIKGPGEIVATDNGDPTSFELFQSHDRTAFNGLCLVIIRGKPGQPGKIELIAKADGLKTGLASIKTTLTSN
jgi:hypothetical protein